MSNYDQEAVMQTLLPSNQRDIVEPYINKFFEVVPKIFKFRTKDDRSSFFHYLSPSKFADEEILAKYKQLLNHPDATSSLKKHTSDEIERIEKFLKGQKLYLESIKDSPKFRALI
jgi:hypothetical protein